MAKSFGGDEKYDGDEIAEHALEYIVAYGPSSSNAILNYVHEQHNPSTPMWRVSAAITRLIREKKVEIYDTGDSFVVS